MAVVLYQWLFAHLLADFILQTTKAVQHKRRLKQRSWVLYAHCLLHAGLVYLFSPDKSLWIIPVIVFVTHFFIDLWKLYQKENGLFFILDQAMHVIVLVATWLIFYERTDWFFFKVASIFANKKLWLILTGYLIIIFPLSFALGFVTQRWRKGIEASFQKSSISLSEAGRWIGIFERILVLTFVLVNHFEGIGFLIAAKSILRFNDIKGADVRKEAEYVLIGTLMSFSSSILIGIIVNLLIK